MNDDELLHYGVKGMKWGIRRYQNKDGTLTSAGKKRSRTRGWSKDAKNAERIKKKSVHEMTNKELQQLNKRMELEGNYRRLNPNKVRRGLAFVGVVAGGMGTVASLYNKSNNLVKIGKQVLKAAKRN